MKKIPVAQTVAEAYRFTFSGLGRIIGLTWLPIIIMTVGGYFIQTTYLATMPGSLESGDLSRQGPMIARMIGFALVSMVLFAMIAVAITREILAPVKRPLFMRFALGPAEFRVVGGYFGLVALLFVFVIGTFLIGLVVGIVVKLAAGGHAMSAQVAAGVGGLIGLVGVCALFYIFVRLSFLLVPAAATEGKFGLERSWELTKGNFWRIFLIFLATLIPLVLVSLAIDVAVLGTDFLNPHFELARDPVARAHHAAEQLRQMSTHLPLLMGIRFLMAPFIYGLTVSPAAFAYRALTAK